MRIDGESDSEIIGRSLTKPEAFGEIYERHGMAIAAYVMRRVDPHRVEDVVAEVFVAAFRRRRRYDLGEPNCLPWLYGIARNVVRNERRWWRRHRIERLRLPVESVVEDIADAVIERADAEALLARISPTLASLRDEERVPLQMLAEGFTYSEIAAYLDCRVGTVKSRVSRARAKILALYRGVGR